MTNINIRYAGISDWDYLIKKDKLITEPMIKKKLSDQQYMVCLEDRSYRGFLRFGYGWDLIPFLNLIIVEKEVRGTGIGRKMINFWEEEMRKAGHKLVMTSTDVDEQAQHFYRKLGYADSGGIIFPKSIYPDSAMELVMIKVLKNK
ncbi:MAG: hypothetical protein APR63_02810 [Desulfuromonas sp. SDB]|nr:MAG: hypothetical protein APR63_02810 [Desulfuromonas sp. SDB]